MIAGFHLVQMPAVAEILASAGKFCGINCYTYCNINFV